MRALNLSPSKHARLVESPLAPFPSTHTRVGRNGASGTFRAFRGRCDGVGYGVCVYLIDHTTLCPGTKVPTMIVQGRVGGKNHPGGVVS